MKGVRAIHAEWHYRGSVVPASCLGPSGAPRMGGGEVRTFEIVVLSALLIPGALLLVLLATTLLGEWFGAGRHGHVPPPPPPHWQQSRRLRGKSEGDEVK
jgi:hypothetical protein